MTERDPVCGMAVDPARAKATREHAGTRFYFCCESCATKFTADPAKYLSPKSAPVVALRTGLSAAPVVASRTAAEAKPATKAPKQTFYVCPMDPEVREDFPGACPKCGMALEPDIPAAAATRMEYTCPMHPQIVRSEPGSCPICGMALEPRTAVGGRRRKSRARLD